MPRDHDIDLTAGSKPQVLSFGLHLPAADAESMRRANQFVSAINR
jgi:hypothetical protein